jgi:hypothetical protein
MAPVFSLVFVLRTMGRNCRKKCPAVILPMKKVQYRFHKRYFILKGQSREKVGKLRVWGVNLGPNQNS